MIDQQPRILVLLGQRLGDNNQLLALAETLGLPFETRTLEYRRLWPALLYLFPTSPYLLTAAARRRLGPPWPDLVLGIGRRSIAVARWIQRMSGGRTRLVRLGNPRADPSLFDLVITTPQYPVPEAPNVILLPLAMSRHRARTQPTAGESEWLGGLPRPHLLFALGGTTRYWRLPTTRILDSARTLFRRAAAAGGSLIIVSSPRTPTYLLDALEAQLGDQPNCRFVSGGRIRFAVLLDDADENHVTGDSVSMISEAVLAGKPVGVVPVELDREGKRKLGDDKASVRDIRRFWAGLSDSGMLGTVENPRWSPVPDPVETAAAAVRNLLAR